jgi:hypothetical protein
MDFFKRYTFAFNECKRALDGRIMNSSRVMQCRKIAFFYAVKSWKSLCKIYYRLSCFGDPNLCRLTEALGLDIVKKMTRKSQIENVIKFAKHEAYARNFGAIAKSITTEEDINRLRKFEKEERPDEYVNALEKFGLMTQIELVSGLENETCLQKVAISKLDSSVAAIAIMKIQNIDILIDIIALNKYTSANKEQIAILRLIDFEVNDKIRTFLNSITDNAAYNPCVRRVAKLLVENQQLIRELKAKAYYPRCTAEPIKWVGNLEQLIITASRKT